MNALALLAKKPGTEQDGSQQAASSALDECATSAVLYCTTGATGPSARGGEWEYRRYISLLFWERGYGGVRWLPGGHSRSVSLRGCGWLIGLPAV